MAELEGSLKQLSAAREAQSRALENIRRNAALLNEQRKTVASIQTQLKRSQDALTSSDARIAAKENERAEYLDLVERAKEIKSAYKAWQKTRKELEAFDANAVKFREHDEKRQPLLREIEVEKAKLEQEGEELEKQLTVVSGQLSAVDELEKQLSWLRLL